MRTVQERRIAAWRLLAWLALVWERAWRHGWWIAAVIGAFVALALLRVPQALGGWLQLALLVLFALLLAAAVGYLILRFAQPGLAEAQRRLEVSSELAHRPLTTLDDRLAIGGDAAGSTLWKEHRRRMAASIANLRPVLPRPGVPAQDPWALRSLIVLGLAVGVMVGWHDAGARIGAALSPNLAGPPTPAPVVDAWISPPAYTGVPPVALDPDRTDKLIRVPDGSTLLARVFGGEETPELELDNLSEIENPRYAFETIDARNHELTQVLNVSGHLRIVQGDRHLVTWPLELVRDQAPNVQFIDRPKSTARGALRLAYEASDDYGVAFVRVELRLPDLDSKEVVVRPLPLPRRAGQKVQELAFVDLTPHPWAGLRVRMRLVAGDDAGNLGESGERVVTLPARDFNHPVAKAVIEQRKILSRTPERRPKVALALRAIGGLTDAYDEDVVVYLALSSAAHRLMRPDGADLVGQVQELLWDTALRIEDGGVSLAERELRAAQQELMEALARDAPDHEIERLMDRLQEAMEKYMQALLEQSLRQARQGQEPSQQELDNTRSMGMEQLKEMLERAREMSRMGARDSAREMLRQLQEMLENLRSGPMQAMENAARGEQAMRELGDLMRRQQQLMDRTFRRSQRGREQADQQSGMPFGQPRPGNQRGRPQPGGEPQGPMTGMALEQEALRRRLGELMRELGEMTNQIPRPLGRADQEMRGARDSLRQGEADSAVDAQTRALDQLAQGLRGLAENMARQYGGDDTGPGPFGMDEEDPLGRPIPSGGADTSRVKIPERADVQRAREILDELRRRSGEFRRPDHERAYIDRLLERF